MLKSNTVAYKLFPDCSLVHSMHEALSQINNIFIYTFEREEEIMNSELKMEMKLLMAVIKKKYWVITQRFFTNESNNNHRMIFKKKKSLFLFKL